MVYLSVFQESQGSIVRSVKLGVRKRLDKSGLPGWRNPRGRDRSFHSRRVNDVENQALLTDGKSLLISC